MTVHYGSLVYGTMNEDLTQRNDPSRFFQRCQEGIMVPVDWDEETKAWVVVLRIDKVSIAQLCSFLSAYQSTHIVHNQHERYSC